VLRRQPDLADILVRSMAAVKRSDNQDMEDLRVALRKSDVARAGELERGEFARVLLRFGFKLTPADERHLSDSLGEGRSGIDYTDFCDALKKEMDRSEAGHRSGEDRDRAIDGQRDRRDDGPRAVALLDDILERLKKRISRDLKHGYSLADEFKKMDINNDGVLSADELERGMDKMGIPLSQEESRKVIRQFAGPKSDEIYFKDFVKAMTPFSGDKGESVSELIDYIQRMLEDRLGSSSNAASTLKRAFEDIDANGDGKLTELEFRRAMAEQKVFL
jgi:hypothetical protein